MRARQSDVLPDDMDSWDTMMWIFHLLRTRPVGWLPSRETYNSPNMTNWTRDPTVYPVFRPLYRLKEKKIRFFALEPWASNRKSRTYSQTFGPMSNGWFHRRSCSRLMRLFPVVLRPWHSSTRSAWTTCCTGFWSTRFLHCFRRRWKSPGEPSAVCRSGSNRLCTRPRRCAADSDDPVRQVSNPRAPRRLQCVRHTYTCPRLRIASRWSWVCSGRAGPL